MWNHRRRLARAFWLILLFLVGCNPVTQTSSPTATNQPLIPSARQITSTASPTPEPSLSPVPPTVTPEPSIVPPTPTFTPTAIPTLKLEAYQKELIRLMETNNNCLRDCFWGIIPGKTRFEQAVSALAPLNNYEIKILDNRNKEFDACYLYIDTDVSACIQFPEENDVVQFIHVTVVGLEVPDITGQDWLPFRSDSILKTYGVPIQVKIVIASAPEGHGGYGFALLFKNMYIKYSGPQIKFDSSKIVHICPNLDHNVTRFDLWIGPYEERDLNFDRNINQVTPLSTDTFYDRLTGDPKNACFDVDIRKFGIP